MIQVLVNKKGIVTVIALVVVMLASNNVFAQDAAIQKKVNALLAKMTLEEKVGQLNQYSGRELTGPGSNKNTNKLKEIKAGKVGSMLNIKGVAETREIQTAALQSRLKIPLLFSLDVIHGYKTIFPVPLAEAATWDLEAIKLSAHIAAKEAAASGIHWTFAPMVDIARDPRWGRVMEGAGEDTYLGSLIAEARVKGFQGNKLGSTDAVMACAKHFAAYGAALAGRDYSAVDMSDNMLLQTYLPPFKAAADAGVATFMNSFNTLNGVPATGNSFLQRDILKGKWNFKGFVVSDWASIAEMIAHGYAKDTTDAGLKAITAGSDMDMEGHIYTSSLVALVKAGKVNIALVNDAVSRILYKKFELGLFDNPFKFCDDQREKEVLNNPQHRLAALDVAQKSLVLLKNDNAILPIQKTIKSIAVIGPLANSKRDLEGAWIVKSDTSLVVSLLEGMQQKAGKKTNIMYAQGCIANGNSEDGFKAAIDAANKAEVVVLAIGETFDLSGEAKSRTDITIPGQQVKLFEALKATGKPIVVVIMAGRPLVFNDIADKANAIVYAWFAGCEGGNAIANVLFGNYNPSGKLPITFPRNIGQIPLYYNYLNTGRPILNDKNIVYKSAYIDAPNTPRFAFGYGLSYTTFAYSNLQISRAKITSKDSVTVSFVLTNTGKVAGEEVAQMYIRDVVASIARPVKELKDFSKVKLQAGENKTIFFNIKASKLAFYNQQLKWDTEPGMFQIMIGGASDDIKLQGNFELLN